MFESLDDELETGGNNGPTRVVALIFGCLAYLLVSLFGSSAQAGMSVIFVAGLILAMSAEWDLREKWYFWLVFGGRLAVDACLVIFVPWPTTHLNAPALFGLIAVDSLLNLGLIAGTASLFKARSE